RLSTAADRTRMCFTLEVFTHPSLWFLLQRRKSTAAKADLPNHIEHHLLDFFKENDELVNVCDLNTKTESDTHAARRAQHLRVFALFWCHTADDRLDAVDVLLINPLGHLAHLLAAWHHLEQVANWAHLADHQQLVEEVIQS